MKKPSKKMGRPIVPSYLKATITTKVSPREMESLERITGLSLTKALRHAVNDFIKRNGGYSDEQSK